MTETSLSICNANQWTGFYLVTILALNGMMLTHLFPHALFLYPLKTSENLTIFWCFQRVERRRIGNKWVKLLCAHILFLIFSESLRKMNVKSIIIHVWYYTLLVNCGLVFCCLIFKCVYISMPENVNKIPNIRFDIMLSLKKR